MAKIETICGAISDALNLFFLHTSATIWQLEYVLSDPGPPSLSIVAHAHTVKQSLRPAHLSANWIAISQLSSTGSQNE